MFAPRVSLQLFHQSFNHTRAHAANILHAYRSKTPLAPQVLSQQSHRSLHNGHHTETHLRRAQGNYCQGAKVNGQQAKKLCKPRASSQHQTVACENTHTPCDPVSAGIPIRSSPHPTPMPASMQACMHDIGLSADSCPSGTPCQLRPKNHHKKNKEPHTELILKITGTCQSNTVIVTTAPCPANTHPSF